MQSQRSKRFMVEFVHHKTLTPMNSSSSFRLSPEFWRQNPTLIRPVRSAPETVSPENIILLLRFPSGSVSRWKALTYLRSRSVRFAPNSVRCSKARIRRLGALSTQHGIAYRNGSADITIRAPAARQHNSAESWPFILHEYVPCSVAPRDAWRTP